MSFRTDNQTIKDLNLMGKFSEGTIYHLFNKTRTKGGADLLEGMFLSPLGDTKKINERAGIFQLFSSLQISFAFRAASLDSLALYLSKTDSRTQLKVDQQSMTKRLGQLLSSDGDYELIYDGVTSALEIIILLKRFILDVSHSANDTPYQPIIRQMESLLSGPDFTTFPQLKLNKKLPFEIVAEYDALLRFKLSAEVKKVLSWIFEIDVYITVAELAREKDFVFPEALSKGAHIVEISQLKHPLVKNAVANDIRIAPEGNVIFLTGANMAGKSTFMKSIGIAMYLAHMGFPVPASSMRFSVREGIFTTINLPDDLSSGNSHFYAEVLRVKKIAKELSMNRDLFIMFDELFRGTNVKDAEEGTLLLTEAFARKTNCMFIVSTHIIEAGAELKKRCKNISFLFLPTLMDGNKPLYTYKLKQGITADRHGMLIINNERILELIRSRHQTQPL